MKRTKGSQSELGMLYQYGVTALLAAELSGNDHVADYIIYSSEKSAGKFDDIVARIKLKEQDQWYSYLVQVKYKATKKLNVSDSLKGNRVEYFLSDYIKCFNDILNNPNLICREGIPNENISFNIFCDGGIQMPVFLRQDCTFQLSLCRNSEKSDVKNNDLLPFGNEYWKFVCKDLEKSEFQHFFNKCYLYVNKPNYSKLNKLIGETCQITNTKEIINYVKDYFNDDDLYKQGLRKEVFEIELQKIRLIDDIPPLTSLRDLIDDNSRIAMWNEITINHDITAVNCMQTVDIEAYLYSCLVRKINTLLNVNIDWQTCFSKSNNLSNELIETFLTYSKTKPLRYWIDPPNTLRLLIIELWKCGDLPLILETRIPLNKFERYSNLRRSYIIVDDWTDRSEEVTTCKMDIFTSLSSITNPELQDRILKEIVVSPQGRKPVTLKNLLRDDEELLTAFTCVDVLRMMKNRTPFLKEGYYKGCDYLAFIIEDEGCAEISDRIEPYAIGHNVRVCCPPGQTDECIKMIRGHADTSQHYTIYHLRKTGERLVLTQGDPQKLNHRFVDEYGEPLFISNTGECIPIIGQAIDLNELRYIPRQLRRVTLPRSFFSAKETQICLLSGDIDCMGRSIEFSNIDDVVNETISMDKKTYFIKIHKNGNRQYYWRKLCHLKYPILDIYSRDGRLELLRYKNCKNLNDHISYDGSVYSEQEFFDEIRDKYDEIAVVTGDAGIGKTSFLRWLCNNYSTQDYIIFYDLINLQVDLNKSKRQRVDLIDFIFEDTQKGLPKQYTDFVSNLRRQKKLIWVLDSFDEIRLACEQQVLDLIGIIADSGAQIIIASRIENCKVLMDEFEVRLIKIEALEENDCNSYWELNQELLAIMSSELATNPLYLNFLKVISINREELVNITKYTLYEKIINMKIKHCLRTTYQILHDSDIERAVLLFERLALVVLFGKEVIEEELHWMCDNEVFDMTKFGIVIRFDEDGYPIFYHRSFVEFLFAQWIGKAYHTRIYKSAARYLYKRIFNENKLYILNILFENEELHRAILQTDVQTVRDILDRDSGCDFWNIVDKLDRTVLHVAAICSIYSSYQVDTLEILDNILKTLLQNQSYINKFDIMYCDWSAYIHYRNLLQAFMHRLMNVTKMYLQLQRKKIQEHNSPFSIFPTQYFYRVLHEAVERFEFDIISDLIFLQNFENKVFFYVYRACLGLVPDNVLCSIKDFRCEGVFTLLHIACIYGKVSTIQRLIEAGFNVNARDYFTCIPLHYSIMRCLSSRAENVCERNQNIEAVKLLLKAGAESSVPTCQAGNVSPLCLAVQTKDITIVKMLLEVSVSICSPCGNGDTALHIGVRNGSIDIVRCILRQGIPLHYKNDQSETAMDIAVKLNNTEMIDLLNEVENATNVQEKETRAVYVGPSRKIKDKSLDHAIISGNIDLIKVLLRRGTNVNVGGISRFPPLFRALVENNVDIIKLLLTKGADVNFIDARGNTPLYLAVINGDTSVIEMILNGGADIDKANDCGGTALHYAVRNTNVILAKLLLERGASVDAQSVNDVTPLRLAIEASSEDCVKLLLENGANPDIQTRDSRAALHAAVDKQNKKIIELLVRKGANVNVRDELETSPLYLATRNKDIATIQLLLENGANINDEDVAGSTPLLLAVRNGSEDIVRLLLEKGAKTNAFTKLNVSALLVGARTEHVHIVSLLLKANTAIDRKGGVAALMLCTRKGDIDSIRLLLTRGINANSYEDRTGISALHLAATSGCTKIVELLLENGAHINANCGKFFTPLYQAVWAKNKDIVELLINKGANINAKDKNGQTVLLLAIRIGDISVIELLLEKNIDISHEIGAEALAYAVELQNIKIVELLLEYGADVNIVSSNKDLPFLKAAAENIEITRLLIDKGANVDSTNSSHINANCGNFFTGLFQALMLTNKDIAELLINKGANIRVYKNGKDGETVSAIALQGIGILELLLEKNIDINHETGVEALEYAVRRKDIKLVDLLLNKGVNVNIRAKSGYTPLYNATDTGDVDIVKLLLEYGADVNIVSENEDLPFFNAVMAGNIEIARLLIDKGANVDTANSFGTTALHLKTYKKDVNFVKLLIEKRADLNIRPKGGYNALQIAIAVEDANILEILLEGGADINLQTAKGDNMLLFAARKGKACLVELLMRKGASIVTDSVTGNTLLHDCVREGNVNIMEVLLKEKVDLNIQDNMGNTPLHIGVIEENANLVKLLLDNNADSDIANVNGETPFEIIVGKLCADIVGSDSAHLKTGENMEIMSSILENMKKIDINDEAVIKLFYWAAEKDCLKIIKLLLHHGVNVNVQNQSGQTPLHIAVINCNEDIVETLLEGGADVCLKTDDGFTPLCLAKLKGYTNIIELFAAFTLSLSAL